MHVVSLFPNRPSYYAESIAPLDDVDRDYCIAATACSSS